MPVASHDHPLELHQLLPALIEQGLITAQAAQKISAAPCNQHPLECIAAEGPCLETLTQWLARHAGQTYLRIDPLKIDVAAVVPLMSHAFAQRHGILAVAVDGKPGSPKCSSARSGAWLPTPGISSAASTSFTGWPSQFVAPIKR